MKRKFVFIELQLNSIEKLNNFKYKILGENLNLIKLKSKSILKKQDM
jgi:hypothetical protein